MKTGSNFTSSIATALPTEQINSAPERYSPDVHVRVSNLKPIKLLDISKAGPWHTALLEFEGGFIRAIEVDSEAAWHPMFDHLPIDDQHRLHDSAAKRVRGADGVTKIRAWPVWFWTNSFGPHNKILGENLFDVPNEEYQEGRITGSQAALDLLIAIRLHGSKDAVGWRIGLSVKAAFGALSESADTPSRRGAAIAFCNLLEDSIFFFARHANFAPHIESRIEQEKESLAWLANRQEQQRKERADRMALVRAAKRRVDMSSGAIRSEGLTLEETAL